MIKEVLVLENILTSTQMYVVKGYGLKADLELLGNRISIMVNNISARKYTHSPRSSVYLYIFSLRNSTGSPELFRVTTCNHGSALMLCKSLQSRAVFLHLNVDLLKPYKSVLFVKRKKSLSVVSDIRYNCNSADGDSVRVWFACTVGSVSGRILLLIVDRLWQYKSVLFVKREISLVVPNSRCSCNSAGGDSVRVWFDSYSEWQDAALTVDLLWPCKSVLFLKDNNVQLG